LFALLKHIHLLFAVNSIFTAILQPTARKIWGRVYGAPKIALAVLAAAIRPEIETSVVLAK
jgi:hypothetical protein